MLLGSCLLPRLRFQLVLLFLFVLVSPKLISAQAISYEEGLANCDSIRDEINKENEATGEHKMLRATCLTGASLPDFTATTMDGKTIDKDYFKGKVTLINFWMKTCGPCIAEIPGLNKIKERFAGQPINFLAVGRCNEEDAEVFLQQHPWNFDQVKNGLDLIEGVFQFRWGYPVTMLINKEGEIVMCFNGGVTGPGAEQLIQNKLIPPIEAELAK
jgi:thiol-disulfide isomerase/thioredoxin